MSRNLNYIGDFKCECGRTFTKSQSYYAHCSHCKIHLGDRYNESKHGDRFGDSRSWNKGLTKETNASVKKFSDTLKKNPPRGFLGKHHIYENKVKLSKIAKYNAKNHINGWKAGNNKIQNKYEKFTSEFLTDCNIEFKSEYTLKGSLVGNNTTPYYQLDFLIDNNIDLELDGVGSHNAEHDNIRDTYVSNLYKIYRIKHQNSMDILKQELDKFLNLYKQNLI